MWRYFLPMAMTIVAIGTGEIVPGEERCYLSCDRMKLPGPRIPYMLVQCDSNQVCMQTMNYTTDITLMDNKRRKESIVFLHRYCALADDCREQCRMVMLEDTNIMTCVSCMNTTTFGHEGKLISQMICHDGNGPVIDPEGDNQ